VELVTTPASAERLPVLLAPGPGGGAAAARFGGRFAAPITYAVFGLLNILVFGAHAHGDATLAFTPEFAKVSVPNLTLAAAATCYVCGVVSIALAAARTLDVLGVIHLGRVWRRVVVGAVLFLFIISLLAWADGGQTIPFNIVNLLSGTLSDSIPIMLGALTGVICSTSGVINIAIEGQLLLGAFCAAIATSATGSLWLGLVCGALAGSLVGILLAGVQIGLTRTRWGLRTRAVGEHPVAADTVGIWVLAYRYRNVILAGLIAGIGGAYFTIGSVGSFGPDMTSGEGYIALAAMIFGRYTPFGAIGAALLFGFTTQLQSVLSSINVPIQSNLLLLTPYVVTIVVVAGLVGKVRGPRAEGVPFIKS
jgi:general nucleoside transport system permease protein